MAKRLFCGMGTNPEDGVHINKLRYNLNKKNENPATGKVRLNSIIFSKFYHKNNVSDLMTGLIGVLIVKNQTLNKKRRFFMVMMGIKQLF